ncbi:MAG: hypothetical protein JKY54_16860 [Flavobacteriales bacterium]|nr:hypothetical protein [Flavobacteriales bacterium]
MKDLGIVRTVTPSGRGSRHLVRTTFDHSGIEPKWTIYIDGSEFLEVNTIRNSYNEEWIKGLIEEELKVWQLLGKL